MRFEQINEAVFQNNIIDAMLTSGWQRGEGKQYDRERALYSDDLLTYIKTTQKTEWDKFCTLFPSDSEEHFLSFVAKQLGKTDPHAVEKELRKFGTLGVLRNELRIRNTRFKLCQFRPEHLLNDQLKANYVANIFRIVPELVYSPHTRATTKETRPAKAYRIDLVLFLNGIPIVTMELKSEFKQSIDQAVMQYKDTRLPIDATTRGKEPLLTFKRGALVHFAVSQYEVKMCTKLAGKASYFLPFNRGTIDGGAGNDIPEDPTKYTTHYLWDEVLQPDNLLNIIGHFIHLEITLEESDGTGLKSYKESLIFPRYHQWDVVRKLLNATKIEGLGKRYLVQHSAGSGKSNSIAWVAHQLSRLYTEQGERQFHSVIVVTDRTILDDQLQETITQFEHKEGAIVRINDEEGSGSKSEKLASALENSVAIIIVTIQTFPFVIKHIESNVSLKSQRYAIIADEAHSSQSGATARKLKQTLMHDEAEIDPQQAIEELMEARRGSTNLNYYAFTATPKATTMQLFGTLPDPTVPISNKNKPAPFHVYSMRQAIEEGFILDVLKNYTTYQIAYQLAQKYEERDNLVDSSRATKKINHWVRLNEHNIAQKVKVMIEHFRSNVQSLLNRQAKAMIVASSRKEIVLYKKAFDRYVEANNYHDLGALIAFSGEVTFDEHDQHTESFRDQNFTEYNMNPYLKGRDLRGAFDSDEFQMMLVANKFQTGFDQPKLCAMYIDRKLGGVDCVQTLSRLNRIYPGKADVGTFILDFVNKPEDIVEAFEPYYQTVELTEVSNPDLIFDLFDKLRSLDILVWREIEDFFTAFFTEKESNATLSNLCKPAVLRWQSRYNENYNRSIEEKLLFERTKLSKDPVLMANAENRMKAAQKVLDQLMMFKKELSSYFRYYEFISQIVDFNDESLEKMALYARNLEPLLKIRFDEEDPIDLDNLTMTHYRLSCIREQNISLSKERGSLQAGISMGTGRAKDQKEELMAYIIRRMNDLFRDENLSDGDKLNYAITISSKVREHESVMQQIRNNPRDQVMHGDFPELLGELMHESGTANRSMFMHFMSDTQTQREFTELVLDLIIKNPEELRGLSPR